MDDAHYRFYPVLQPFAFLYQAAVALRNFCFNRGLLPSVSYSIPVICVGNLAVGGTGKTPLVEYLIRLLSGRFRVAVLSRGYKRKSTGYVLADENSTAREIGDEACQIKVKFPQVTVAVDKHRRRGMRNLLALPENVRPQVIILDDAFQHRYVKPSLSIIVTACNRLFFKDKLLPVGHLREPATSVARAELLLISKCPENINEPEILQQLPEKFREDNVFFSKIEYQPPVSVFPQYHPHQFLQLDGMKDKVNILLFTGIANPAPLIVEIGKYTANLRSLSFGDHHAFTKRDIEKIQRMLSQMPGDSPLIICTEKDAARLRHLEFIPDDWKSRLYYIPMKMRLLFGKENLFEKKIIQHISLLEN
ncbi:MAG: tetraacyldisaccharide 4'-kinase [Tannerella sp.]|jgi:tetraacyldisaccharide 4'-kinase|nr:tetraacyldisaccharide 4'-kinase [Tannerella sp.]